MIKYSTIVLCITIVLTVIYEVFGYGSGGIPAYSNAPSESNCTSCHSGTSLNGGGYLSNMIFTPNFSGGGYIPDSTYTMTVAFKQPGRSKYGLQVTCLDETSNLKIGTFTTADTKTQISTTSVGGKTRQYVEHTSSGTAQTSKDSIYWKFKWKAPATNAGKIKFYVVVNATNSDNQDVGDHIYAKSFSYGLSTLLPVADARCLDSVSCSGNTVRFTGSGTQNPTSYSWSFPGGTPSTSTAQNPNVTYSTAGVKLGILTVKNAYGVSTPDTFKCVVNLTPQLTYNGKPVYNICPGDSVKLTVLSSTSGATYKWTPGNKTTSVIFVKDTGTYYVTVKAPSGCEKTGIPIRINHKRKPTVTLTTSPTGDTLCKGTQVTLTGVSAYPDSFYFYNDGKIIGRSKLSGFNTILNSNSKYTVVVRDTNTCYSDPSPAKHIVAKDPLTTPVINCQPGTTTSLVFLWSGIPSAQGYEVSIDSGASWQTPTSGNMGNSHTISGLQPDTRVRVRLRVKDIAPCYYSAEASAVCQSLPCSNIAFEVLNDTLICRGETATVKVKGLYDDRYTISFNGGPYSADTLFSLKPVFTKTYTLQLRDSNNLGCPLISRFATVEVDTIPSGTQLTLNQTICKGSQAAVYSSQARGYTFLFNDNIIYMGTDSNYAFTPAVDGSLKVQRQFKACRDTSVFGSVTVKRIPDASFSFTNNHYDYTFKAKDTMASSYMWMFSDTVSISGDTISRNLKKFSAGSVQVLLEVSDFGGCSGRDSTIVSVPDYSSIITPGTERYLQVFPNPAEDRITVVLQTTIVPEYMNVSISSIDGRLMKHVKGRGNSLDVNIEELPAGMYLITVESPDSMFRKRIMIE